MKRWVKLCANFLSIAITAQYLKNVHRAEAIKKKNQARQLGIFIEMVESQDFTSYHILQLLHPFLSGFPIQFPLDAMPRL